jgi:type II secretory pathway component HofQ
MLKHIGRHQDKKVVLLYRQVPGEEHMCLVTYSDALPQLIHDELMKVLESPVGQAAKELNEPLFRTIMADGRNCLEALHKSNLIKKVPTNQIIITPNAKSSVRLDELNQILNEMEQGEEAVKRLAEMDASRGFTGRREAKEVGANPASRTQAANIVSTATLGEVLTDEQLAGQRAAQAAKMKLEAAQLLAEAARLESEAVSLNPVTTLTPNAKPRSTKAKVTKKTASKQAS